MPRLIWFYTVLKCFAMHYFVSILVLQSSWRGSTLVVLLLLSYICIVTINVLWLFLMVPWVGLQCLIVVFPDHIQLLFAGFVTHMKEFWHLPSWILRLNLQNLNAVLIKDNCFILLVSYSNLFWFYSFVFNFLPGSTLSSILDAIFDFPGNNNYYHLIVLYKKVSEYD